MGKTADQITAEIDRSREQLQVNLLELETRVKSAADWRVQFQRHPGRMAAAAVVGGMLLAKLIGRR